VRVLLIQPALLLMLVLSACGPDSGQVALCTRILGVVVPGGDLARVTDQKATGGTKSTIELTYELPQQLAGKAPAGGNGPRKFRCLFASGGLRKGRLELVGVVRNSGAPLHPVSLLYLRRRLNLR